MLLDLKFLSFAQLGNSLTNTIYCCLLLSNNYLNFIIIPENILHKFISTDQTPFFREFSNLLSFEQLMMLAKILKDDRFVAV